MTLILKYIYFGRKGGEKHEEGYESFNDTCNVSYDV